MLTDIKMCLLFKMHKNFTWLWEGGEWKSGPWFLSVVAQ